MDAERIADLAHAVAELEAGDKDYFEGVLADARARIDEEAEASRLRELSDVKAVAFVIWTCTTHCRSSDDEKALRLLRAAGFERFPAKPEPMTSLLIGEDNPAEIKLRAPRESFDALVAVLQAAGHQVRWSK